MSQERGNFKKKIGYERGGIKLCVIVVIRLVMWHFIALYSAFCDFFTSLCDKIRHILFGGNYVDGNRDVVISFYWNYDKRAEVSRKRWNNEKGINWHYEKVLLKMFHAKHFGFIRLLNNKNPVSTKIFALRTKTIRTD